MKQKRKSLPILLQIMLNTNPNLEECFAPNVNWSLKMTGASILANIFVGLGKLVMGIVSMSFFTCVNAFYTFGMVIAKYFALAGIVKSNDVNEQYRYYIFSGVILTTSSLIYIAYSVRLFFHPATSVYHMYVALVIAVFTFTEITINIRGVIFERHNHTPLIHAIKMINLASSLICLVLTQTAILSFTDSQVDLHPVANGQIGILMGSCATVLGLSMIVRMRKIQTGKNYRKAYKNVKRVMKKEHIYTPMRPIQYLDSPYGAPILYVKLQENIRKTEFNRLQTLVKQQLQMQLIYIDNEKAE